MASAKAARRLIINADDFGRSSEINRAVLRAHTEGVLTSASLMVGGEACEEAVQMARAHPSLGVGLHLTFCHGRPVLAPGDIPQLVDHRGLLYHNPVRAGLECFFLPQARRQLRLEMEAQFQRFQSTGLALDHVNGHLHFHLHPAAVHVLRELIPIYNVRAARLTREPWELNFLQESGRWGYRLSHAFIFELLSRRAQPVFEEAGVAFTRQVFGLLQDGRVSENYLLGLISSLPAGSSEVYSHPSLCESHTELKALTSPRVRQALDRNNIELIRYQDLWSNC